MRPVQRGDVPVTETVYDVTDNEYFSTAMVIKYPLKFRMPDTLKTVFTVVSGGIFSKWNDILKIMLPGSIDEINYIPVASSLSGEIRNIRGSEYKYFKLMHELQLKHYECFNGIEIDFQQKRTNILRQ